MEDRNSFNNTKKKVSNKKDSIQLRLKTSEVNIMHEITLVCNKKSEFSLREWRVSIILKRFFIIKVVIIMRLSILKVIEIERMVSSEKLIIIGINF